MVTGSISRRVNAERLMLLAWPRAILLQLAHPLIAAGVADHSTFRGSGMSALRRLHHTVGAMRALTFGQAAQADKVIADIRAIHTRVHGRLRTGVGRFPAGAPYSAEDPDLLLWVHATLLESLPLTYARLVRALSPAELDAYCDETASVPIALGARADDVPRHWEALLIYLHRVHASGTLVVGDQAKMLATAVLSPHMPLAMPALRVTRRVTLGLLPDDIRRQYGYDWTAEDDTRFERVTRLLRTTRRALPRTIALWPDARRLLD